jgi:hypothetical protein
VFPFVAGGLVVVEMKAAARPMLGTIFHLRHAPDKNAKPFALLHVPVL